MNKSILKHELKSMKWMAALSVMASLGLVMIFNMNLDNMYGEMFFNGLMQNQAVIQESIRYISSMILLVFSAIAVVQVFMQFRAEKEQEIGRFLKSLPVKNSEFLKVKLLTGILNFTIAFIVLIVGVEIVSRANMFWIEDIYSISAFPEVFMEADGILSILKEIGLIYVIVVSFYTFLIMLQYTFSNIIGGIVTGILVWLAPAFILLVSSFTLERFTSIGGLEGLFRLSEWVLPFAYPFQIDYNSLGLNQSSMNLHMLGTIANLPLKYCICLALIAVNIFLAFKFNKDSKVEDENKAIKFKPVRIIFKIGVTVCSALLLSFIFTGFFMVDIPNSFCIILILLGGAIGYMVSRKIAQIGN